MGLWSALVRRKEVVGGNLDTELSRCLTTWDVAILGIGNMVGGGIYVLTGQVTARIAGPSVVVSFVCAGVAAVLSAGCYAEFGAWVPRAGSAYTYTYVTMGEISAFAVGWSLLMEHVIGAAAVARTWSVYVDTLAGHRVSNWTNAKLPLRPHQAPSNDPYSPHQSWDFVSTSPDFLAAAIVLVLSIFVATGAKCSTRLNNFLTLWNVLVIGFIVSYGLSFANLDFWTSPKYGGFFPFGVAGVLAGASRCFFAYIGFDVVATAAEEAQNPSRAVPLATLGSLSFVSSAYVLMSSTLTLMVPWTQVDQGAAFASAFATVGRGWAQYVVAVGALCGMITALAGHLFALPRCIYAMADDGLIFRWLAHIHPWTQVPSLSISLAGLLIAVVACCVSTEALVDLMSMGTLLAFAFVSLCVLVLRYQGASVAPSQQQYSALEEEKGEGEGVVDFVEEEDYPAEGACFPCLGAPSTKMMVFLTFSYLFFAAVLGLAGRFAASSSLATVVGLLLIGGIGLTTCIGVLALHKQTVPQGLFFKVPLVPLVPVLSITVNVVLMLHLTPFTWIRLTIWLAIGLVMYLSYGIRHSSAGANDSTSSSDQMRMRPQGTPFKDR